MGIIFLSQEQKIQRDVFLKQGYGLFGSRFDLVLEKLGLLGITSMSHTDFAQKVHGDNHHMVLCSWLPEDKWSSSLVDRLLSWNGPVFLEGPLPSRIKERLGLAPCGAKLSAPLMLEPVQDKKTFINQSVKLEQIFTWPGKVFKPPWEDFPCRGTRSVDHVMGDVLFKLVNVQLNHFMAHHDFVCPPKEDPLTVWCLVQALWKLPQGESRTIYLQKLIKLFETEAFSQWWAKTAKELGLGPAREAMEHLQELEIPEIDFTQKLRPHLEDLKPSSLENQLWFTAAEMRRGKAGIRSKASAVLLESLEKPDIALSELVAACLVARRLDDESSLAAISKLAAQRLGLPSLGDIEQVKAAGLEVFQAMAVAALTGYREHSRELMGKLLDMFLNQANGQVQLPKHKAGKWSGCLDLLRRPIFTYSSWLGFTLCLLTDEIRDVFNGAALASDHFTESCLSAWHNFPMEAEGADNLNAKVLAWLNTGEMLYPGVVQWDNIVATNFQLFNFIAYHYTMAPQNHPPRIAKTKPAQILEKALLDWIFSQANVHCPLAEVEPWPHGFSGCFTIRHDVDRIPDKPTFRRLFNWERKRALGVSWYWIANRLNQGYLRQIKSAGHEIGLHAVKVNFKKEECESIQRSTGLPIRGECTHQGGGSDEWPAALQLVYAGLAGMDYVITQFDHRHPFRFLLLDNDGSVYAQPAIWCLSYASNVDGLGKSDEKIHVAFQWERQVLKNGHHLIVTNHPDMSFDYLCELEASLPELGRLNWTSAQVVDWWSKSHDRENLSLELTAEDERKWRLRLWSKTGIEGISIRIWGLGVSINRLTPSPGLTVLNHESNSIQTKLGLALEPGKSQLRLSVN